MTSNRHPPNIFVGQRMHFFCAAILLVIVWTLWGFQGQPYPIAFWVAVAVPIAHQIFVWLAWRLEMRSSATSETIGFSGYLVCFFVLFGGRFASLFVLAWLDRFSLKIPVLPQAFITTVLALPAAYAIYSVKRYFGMTRAAGADHFDPRYRDMPLVNKGIYRFTSNGMYLYAFLSFWAIAVGLNSSAALTVAVFSHAYIWVHFFATERPDMKYLYEERSPI